MIRRVIGRLALLLLMAGCADTPGPEAGMDGDPALCVALFRTYDAVAATMSTPSGWRDRMAIPPPLQLPAQRLQNAGCMTLTAELALSADAPPVRDAGAPIPPVGLHAGVVTNMQDEAAAVAFFEARGANPRTVGAAGLGRRIYLGPFATAGALSDATALAIAAGFASPYPADF